MRFLNECGRYLMAGATAQARWEINISNTIFRDRKRLFLLALLLASVLIGMFTCYAFAQGSSALPDMLGGKEAYTPATYAIGIFLAAILVGLIAGLITGCIGAGGGFIITPALMSFGIKGILAVGTDLFHIFAKAIMGAVIHRKLGNVAVKIAIAFGVGSLIGATFGGMLNRALYERNPVLSDAFITSIYSVMLGFLGFYALRQYLNSRKTGGGAIHEGGGETEEIGKLPQKIQSINIPPMIGFDRHIVPGGRRISWIFVALVGLLVGFVASIMGVGGGFLTFPMFVFTLGVSGTTTVGTDIFQIIFTGGYAAISQYAIYGFIFYTLAMGMLLGSLVGIQIGALVTRVVPSTQIRAFYAMAVLAGFANRIFALPGKLGSLGVVSLSSGTGNLLANIGIGVFFFVLGIFAIWVIGTFVRSIKKLKGIEVKT
jgi:uncharacterized protein